MISQVVIIQNERLTFTGHAQFMGNGGLWGFTFTYESAPRFSAIYGMHNGDCWCLWIRCNYIRLKRFLPLGSFHYRHKSQFPKNCPCPASSKVTKQNLRLILSILQSFLFTFFFHRLAFSWCFTFERFWKALSLCQFHNA